MVTATYVAAFSMALLCIGVFVFLSRKSTVSMLIGIELMFNAALFNFIVFAQFAEKPMEGQLMALMILAVAAGEAVIALAMWRKVAQAN